MIVIIAALLVAIVYVHNSTMKADDSYIRQRVVKLMSPEGSCSGIVIEAPKSHKSYTLSAGHCMILVKSGKVTAQLEDGTKTTLDFIAEDAASDLMLLSAPADSQGIEIADRLSIHQAVHTLTHGGGAPTYRTDGEAMGISEAKVPMFDIITDADKVKCSAQIKLQVAQEMGMEYCIMDLDMMVTSAAIIPGSSGGAVVNDSGRLVGIVSAYNGKFSMIVLLSDIERFLKDR
jgi:S1-C subfamily serine protease